MKDELLTEWNDLQYRSWLQSYDPDRYKMIEYYINWKNEQELHLAWQKRAEEAESQLMSLRSSFDELEPYSSFGKTMMEMIEQFCGGDLPEDNTDKFIEVWKRQNDELQRMRTQNSKLRAIKNQLQQELAARPER